MTITRTTRVTLVGFRGTVTSGPYAGAIVSGGALAAADPPDCATNGVEIATLAGLLRAA